MQLSAQLARHLREVHTGGNWTSVNLKDTLNGISWQQAVAKVDSLNTILALTYHIHYYIAGVTNVLEGGSLDIKDKFSYEHPPVASPQEWEELVTRVLQAAEKFAGLIEALPETIWPRVFVDEKYGTYHRNILGIIEHTHYHLGQIAVIKKMLAQQTPA